jgi:hypothetical protein
MVMAMIWHTTSVGQMVSPLPLKITTQTRLSATCLIIGTGISMDIVRWMYTGL